MKWHLLLLALAGLMPAAAATAQGRDHDHADHDQSAGHDHGAMHGGVHDDVPAPVRERIEAVRASVERFETIGGARASGFSPTFGMIPTMGTHWVSRARMRTNLVEGVEEPEHLMFSLVDGEQRLVGAAFSYFAQPDQEAPDLFAGELDRWHTHPELSPPGLELTMLHVWFVPSPDGPFAAHNPWLPYWAVGLEPPEASRLADPTESHRIRALGLALAETLDQGREERILSRATGGRVDAEPRRERIRRLIPVLDRARESGDQEAWDAAADEAIAEWEALLEASLESIQEPQIREQLERLYQDMLTGGHESHRR